jgi:subtilisin family serine protease
MGMSVFRNQRSPRELIVILKTEAGVIDHDEISSFPLTDQASQLSDFLKARGAKIRPIRTQPLLVSDHSTQNKASEIEPLLSQFHHVSAADFILDPLKADLERHPGVEACYIKPASGPPALGFTSPLSNETVISAAKTPNFSNRQGYLMAAPVGVDALHAWTHQGGRGLGVRIIDCEWSWNFSHEDLVSHCGGAIVGTPGTSDDDHGTCVIGSIVGNDNGFGITGIAPDAQLFTAAFPSVETDFGTAAIIMSAADHLSAGDILLLEIHRPGPCAPNPMKSQEGFIAVEWWPDDFKAISYATSRGIIVVEAAGNGVQNLDNPVYSNAPKDFPKGWRNPFALGGPDSGAIIVGAGNPPAGTHGRRHDTLGWDDIYVDRARCGFSNYGSRVDCQGWGWEVTTLGTGDLQGGADSVQNHNRLYTDQFAGTSSASPIISGTLACVQGALRASGRPVLNALSARQILRTTGSPQQAAPGRGVDQHIGLRPDLRAILTLLLRPKKSEPPSDV